MLLSKYSGHRFECDNVEMRLVNDDVRFSSRVRSNRFRGQQHGENEKDELEIEVEEQEEIRKIRISNLKNLLRRSLQAEPEICKLLKNRHLKKLTILHKQKRLSIQGPILQSRSNCDGRK